MLTPYSVEPPFATSGWSAENIYSNFDVLHRIMTTLDVLLPDLTVVSDALSMDRSVQGFLRVVRNLQEEISITDCKVYTASPRSWGHRHEFTTVTANVHG